MPCLQNYVGARIGAFPIGCYCTQRASRVVMVVALVVMVLSVSDSLFVFDAIGSSETRVLRGLQCVASLW